jgi:uncharacterized protein YkwD
MTEPGHRRRIRLPGLALLALLAFAATPAAASPPVRPLAASSSASLPSIASAAACPHRTELGAAPAVQRLAMLCLVNHARQGRGLEPLAASAPLDRAAGRKSADILGCDEFSHEACGHEFTYWMERFGYLRGCAGAGENIAWGTGELGSVHSIFSAWMHSAGHRENILGDFEDIGIGLRVGSLEGNADAHVWTQDFGNLC